MNKQCMHKGFTLMEMLITVVIMGVLAAVAIPQYMASVNKSNRSEAKAELAEVSQRLQRCYTSFGRYNSPNCAVKTDLEANAGAGITTRSGYYNISLMPGMTATTYQLLATVNAGTSQENDKACTKLLVDQLGGKTALDNNGAASTNCW